jgi:hypothetical protein
MAAPSERPDRNDALRLHVAAAEEAARQIAQDGRLNKRQRRAVVKAFRAILLPSDPRRRRRQKKKIARAAYEDSKRGMHGIQLYQKYIPGWIRMNRYKRKCKEQTLRASIRQRKHREKNSVTKPETSQ